jgi:iron complex transport system ATP-binding protein
MILVKNLHFSYNKSKKILENICFDSEKGRCVAVLGNNGAGKSTLIKCLNRILKPSNGVVLVNGAEIKQLKRNDVAKIISYVAQHNCAERFTVYDSVLLGRKPYIKFEPSSEDMAIVESVIKKMGLNDYALRYVDELSGGERQKVMLARALAQQPKILLLDEPTSNLDLHNQYEVFETVKKIAAHNEMLVMIVIHDLEPV